MMNREATTTVILAIDLLNSAAGSKAFLHFYVTSKILTSTYISNVITAKPPVPVRRSAGLVMVTDDSSPLTVMTLGCIEYLGTWEIVFSIGVLTSIYTYV